jgi:hypothetical protein
MENKAGHRGIDKGLSKLGEAEGVNGTNVFPNALQLPPQKRKKMKKNENQKFKSVGIYLSVIIFTFIVNVIILLFSFNFVDNTLNHLNYLKLYTIKPVIFPPLGKIFSMCFILNLLLLLIIEFVIIYLFRKRLNNFFKIDNLFTIKKFLLLAVIIIGVQMILSCWLWFF